MRPLRLLTFAPGQPPAARVQARAVDGVHPRCHVYAPLGADLLAHLAHLHAFNTRPDQPTRWQPDVRAGDDWLARGLREQPGNAAVVAGRPADAPAVLRACVEAGLHVLAAGPWASRPADLPAVGGLLLAADLRELVVWPLRPERFDPAALLLRQLTADPDVFGGFVPGTPDRPALAIDTTRHLHATLGGRPVRWPAWAFDPAAAGDALTNAGAAVDLLLRLLLPDHPPDAGRDFAGIDGTGWPGLLDRDQFAAVTGLPDFPPELLPQVNGNTLAFPANGTVTATVRGVAVRVSALTEADPAAGPGDTLEVLARGTRSTVTVRGGDAPGEVVVVPADAGGPVYAALAGRCQALQGRFPGLSVQDVGGRFRLPLPPPDPDGWAASALAEFVRLFRSPRQVPAWDRAAVVAGHHLTVAASESARRKQAGG